MASGGGRVGGAGESDSGATETAWLGSSNLVIHERKPEVAQRPIKAASISGEEIVRFDLRHDHARAAIEAIGGAESGVPVAAVVVDLHLPHFQPGGDESEARERVDCRRRCRQPTTRRTSLLVVS